MGHPLQHGRSRRTATVAAHRPRHRRGALPAAGLLAVLALAGCADDAPAGGSPTTLLGAGQAPPHTRLDFDGDGRADLAMVSPIDGTLQWDVLLSAGGRFTQAFGDNATDVATPGDFDGDGRTEVAVWRAQAEPAFLIRNDDGSARSVPFGAAGDQPIVADFDGDGRDDPAVVRREDGALSFYVWRSAAEFDRVPFGRDTDEPFVGDYDGDGRAEPAVVRRGAEGAGEMWSLVDGVPVRRVFGVVDTDYYVPRCDVDGDGADDVVVWRGLTAEAPYLWYSDATGGGAATSFGLGGAGGDRPAPADYDGDGRCDIAVWRPSNSSWYVTSSDSGAVTVTRQEGFLPLARIGVL